MIYSLDIFDTLLLRKEDPVKTLSRLPESIREKRLALHQADYPTSLEDFYLADQDSLQKELDLECQFLEINTEIIHFIDAHPDDRFILISDMYLSPQNIEYIFNQLGVPMFYEKLYVSSAEGQSKAAFGQLFNKVGQELGKDIIHIGDHLKSDFLYAASRFDQIPIHYTREHWDYQPDYSSLENYYINYIDNILTPLFHLTIENINEIIIKQDITHVLCLGSVSDFYTRLLTHRHPKLAFSKLEISRFNIQFLLFNHMDTSTFVKQPHTRNFLQHYFPDSFAAQSIGNTENPLSVWKKLATLVELHFEDIKQKSKEVEDNFQQQLEQLDIPNNNCLFIDFGYQGTFCDLKQLHPMLNRNNKHVFFTVKEQNPKHLCQQAIEITPFKHPAKFVRDPFWVLDTEILIKSASATPLAFQKPHQNSLGWPGMYEYLLSSIENFRTELDTYQLKRELEYKIFKHITSIDKNYLQMVNQLFKKVEYKKYSMLTDTTGLIKLQEGICQIDIAKASQMEFDQASTDSLNLTADATPAELSALCKPPYHQFYQYRYSLATQKQILKGEDTSPN